MLFDILQKDLLHSMKAKDDIKTSTLRFLIAALKNEKIALKEESLSDEDVLRTIQRQVKQHNDSIELYKQGKRPELVQKEEQEIAILKSYLPTMLSEDEVKKVVEGKKSALGITDKSSVGRLMGEVMKELKGKADGSAVKKVVEQSLT